MLRVAIFSNKKILSTEMSDLVFVSSCSLHLEPMIHGQKQLCHLQGSTLTIRQAFHTAL